MARMGRLQRAALRWVNEPMEAWDLVTKSWLPAAFLARFDPTDRFLSNFNKPTRRRMLQAAADCVFPESRTFRHPGTKDVYLLGITRKDALGGNPYIGLTVCQLVTDEPGGSSGQVTIYRKAPVGPADDPGWLVDAPVYETYMDIEFVSGSKEAETIDVTIDKFLVYLPQYVDLKVWDFIDLHGKKYRVVDAYADSGFTSGRVDEEEDQRVNFYLDTDGSRTYNTITRRWETTPRQYQVTGTLVRSEGFAKWSSDSEDYIDVYIEHDHIGVVPVPDSMSLTFEGRKRVIRTVHTQAGNRQYLLRCN